MIGAILGGILELEALTYKLNNEGKQQEMHSMHKWLDLI